MYLSEADDVDGQVEVVDLVLDDQFQWRVDVTLLQTQGSEQHTDIIRHEIQSTMTILEQLLKNEN